MKTNKYVLLTVGVLYPIVDYNIADDTISYLEHDRPFEETLTSANNTVCVIDLSNSNSITDQCIETITILKGPTNASEIPKLDPNHIKYIIGILDSNNLIVMKHIERFNKFMGYE